MTVKAFIMLLNSLNFVDELCINVDGEEVWQGHIYDKQVYRHLEEKKVEEMWIGDIGLCITII